MKKRPGGAKSRVPVERGGDDWDRACGDAIARVMIGVRSAIELLNRGLISAGFAPAAGLRRVCGRSAQAPARKSCTADREAAAEPGAGAKTRLTKKGRRRV